MITRKFKYMLQNESMKEAIDSYHHQYNSVYRFIFNRIVDSNNSLSLSDLRSLYGTLKGVDLIDQCMFHCAISDAKASYESRKALEVPVKKKRESEEDYQKRLEEFEDNRFHPVFGGRKRFIMMNQAKSRGDIERFNELKKEFKKRRQIPLRVIGEGNKKGNRKFQVFFEGDTYKVLFKPSLKDHYVFILKINHKHIQKELEQLIEIQSKKTYPLTWPFDDKYLYVSFDEKILKNFKVKPIENRST